MKSGHSASRSGLTRAPKTLRMDDLITRYEEPIAANRWDSPLFTVLPEDDLSLPAPGTDEPWIDRIAEALSGDSLRQNMATMRVGSCFSANGSSSILLTLALSYKEHGDGPTIRPNNRQGNNRRHPSRRLSSIQLWRPSATLPYTRL